MKDIYETLELEKISLSHLSNGDKELRNAMFKSAEAGTNYLSFKTAFLRTDAPIFAYAKKLEKEPEETPLYKIAMDLATRLGIDQGYLVREEVVKREADQKAPHKEFTTGQVAKMAGCSSQAVWKAILTWRLRARKVGKIALIAENDAIAYSNSVRHYGNKRRRQKAHREPVHA